MITTMIDSLQIERLIGNTADVANSVDHLRNWVALFVVLVGMALLFSPSKKNQ